MTAFAWDASGGFDLPEALRKMARDLGIGADCGPDRFDRTESASREGGQGPAGRGQGGPRPGPFAGFGGFPFGPPPGGRSRRDAGPGRGPWGNWGNWGHGQWQKPARAGRGDVRSAVLALLTEQPMHGYQIIQEITRRSNGAWKPSPGSVYPTLQQLEDEGLVRAEELDGRRVYRLTADGEQVSAERADEFAHLWDGFAPDEDDTQLGDLDFGVASAVAHLMRTGSAEQIREAKKVLARTRADLYKILGSDDDAASGEAASDGQDDDGAATDGPSVTDPNGSDRS